MLPFLSAPAELWLNHHQFLASPDREGKMVIQPLVRLHSRVKRARFKLVIGPVKSSRALSEYV